MSQLNTTQSTSSQIVSRSVLVPEGHIVAAESWRGTQVTSAMLESVSVVYYGDLGVVDFMTAEDTAVIFVSEADLLEGGSYRRRVARFRHHNKAGLRGMVLAVTTPLTTQPFAALQAWAGIDMDLTILSVGSAIEAGRLLAQFVVTQQKTKTNPFLQNQTTVPPHTALLSSAAVLPGLGPKRAQQVLSQLGSLRDVTKATPQQLGEVVGNAASAQTLYTFLHHDNRFS